MGPVGLVHQHRNTGGVGEVHDGGDVADHPLVGGAGDDDQPGLWVVRQGCGHGLRRQAPRRAGGLVRRHRQVDGHQVQQLQGVVHRFVASPGQEDRAPGAHGGGDPRQDAAGAAAHQEEGPVRAPEPGGPVHGLPENAVGVVEVVEPVDLRNVQGPGQLSPRSGPLVPRHVHGTRPRPGVGPQLFQQVHLAAPFPLVWPIMAQSGRFCKLSAPYASCVIRPILVLSYAVHKAFQTY